MTFLLIPYLMLCAGYAGGSLPKASILDRTVQIFGKKIKFTWLPELLFALPFGLVAPWYASIFAITWSYLWMQTATAPALHWGQGGYNPKRTSTLKPFVDWVNKYTFKADPSTVQYCRLYMGIKWLLICAPCGFYAPVGALVAVLAYEGGARIKWPHGVTEALTGFGAAVGIMLAL